MENLKLPIIFTDMDETLYSKDFKVSLQTLEDIKFATTKSLENPIPAIFNLCTGNPVFERVKNIGKLVGAKYLIGSTGASIYDYEIHKFIWTNAINDKDALQIIDFAKNNNLEIVFWNTEEYFHANFTNEALLKEALDYHFDTQAGREIIKKYNNHEIKNILKIEFCCLPSKFDLIKKILENLNVNFIETLTNIEVIAKGVSKGEAIKYIVNNFYKNEITLDDVFCAGDSRNDLDMLSICGFSYAMANGTDDIKQVAKYHTSSVEQNGLGEAIIDYLYRYNKIIKKYLLH